jgi:hypothetical protein
MNTSIHIEGWHQYGETQEPIPEPQTLSQLPPERYSESVWERSLSPWSAHKPAKEKKQGAAQAGLDTDRAADNTVAATEAVYNSVFEELAASTLAKPLRARPGPKPKPKSPKPPRKKPGPKPTAKAKEK